MRIDADDRKVMPVLMQMILVFCFDALKCLSKNRLGYRSFHSVPRRMDVKRKQIITYTFVLFRKVRNTTSSPDEAHNQYWEGVEQYLY